MFEMIRSLKRNWLCYAGHYMPVDNSINNRIAYEMVMRLSEIIGPTSLQPYRADGTKQIVKQWSQVS